MGQISFRYAVTCVCDSEYRLSPVTQSVYCKVGSEAAVHYTAANKLHSICIKPYITKGKRGGFDYFTAPSAQSAYPRHKLVSVKGLCKIIISPRVKPRHLIGNIRFCREHHNRYIKSCPAYFAYYSEAVKFGQHNVQYYHIIYSAQSVIKPCFAVTAAVYRIVMLFKQLHKRLAKALFILNNKYAHCRTSFQIYLCIT